MLSLALGIGANVTIFNLVNALMLKALPIHEPGAAGRSGTQAPTDPRRPAATSFTNPQWEYLRDHQDFFSGVLAPGRRRFNLNAGGEARPVAGMYVSGRFFDALGVAPYIGRTFTTDDDLRNGGKDGPVAVLSYGFWQREFGGDQQALGKPITLDGHAFTIIGVSPPEFYGVEVGRTFDVAVPLGTEPIVRGAESDARPPEHVVATALRAPRARTDDGTGDRRGFAAFHPALREATIPQNWRPQDQKRVHRRGHSS